MTRIEQAELQEIVSQLENGGYCADINGFLDPLTDNQAFQRLKELAYQERHPEGSDHLLTGKSWQELNLMLLHTMNFMQEERPKMWQVYELITNEIERRLLTLIPKDK